MRTNIEISLPKMLPGSVCEQMIRCGKPTCKCAKGDLHGPYYYRFVWVNGRQRKLYVKKSELSETIAACENYDQERQRARRENLENMQMLQALRARYEELFRLIHTQI